ncbi:hypothetical protein VE03_10299 [Pseudogymnoascus sp. 23342-1-I1]|nr:hypothetical protein VE03_10299 [Pseudogymnoascus sp. 23342-1-I1]
MKSYGKRKRYKSKAGGGKKSKSATDDVAKGQDDITDNNGIISDGGELQASAGTSPNVPPSFVHLLRGPVTRVPTLMTSLLYLARLEKKLPPQAKGLDSTPHRIFLGCLILSAKFINDISPKNKRWAMWSHVPSISYEHLSQFGFSTTDVNLIERQLLILLDWKLNFGLEELWHNLEPVINIENGPHSSGAPPTNRSRVLKPTKEHNEVKVRRSTKSNEVKNGKGKRGRSKKQPPRQQPSTASYTLSYKAGQRSQGKKVPSLCRSSESSDSNEDSSDELPLDKRLYVVPGTCKAPVDQCLGPKNDRAVKIEGFDNIMVTITIISPDNGKPHIQRRSHCSTTGTLTPLTPPGERANQPDNSAKDPPRASSIDCEPKRLKTIRHGFCNAHERPGRGTPIEVISYSEPDVAKTKT